MIFLGVSWYPIHICANSVFKKFSSNYPNLSVSSVSCWDSDCYSNWHNFTKICFPKTPDDDILPFIFLYYLRESCWIRGEFWEHIFSLSLFFLSTNSKASKPSFHRILELFKHRTTLSIILKSRTEAHQGPALSLHLEMATWIRDGVSIKYLSWMGQIFETWPRDTILVSQDRLDLSAVACYHFNRVTGQSA